MMQDPCLHLEVVCVEWQDTDSEVGVPQALPVDKAQIIHHRYQWWESQEINDQVVLYSSDKEQ